ncbi:MAG TPA: carbohydrate ABC transporter permease [Rubrobacteraceae bacterium]|nr:carbohydrate ABC transporter permease [Rubrobacteraceae bacterium]
MASATAKGGARGNLNMVLFYIFLVVFVLVSMFPLIWIFKMSIVTRAELFQSPPTILPNTPTAENYGTIFGDPRFQKALINSTIIAGVTTVICLFFGSIAAYSIARLRFSFKSLVMTLILAISFFPAVAIIAPLFIQYSQVGLIDTYWAAIITDVVFALPLTIWILVAFFKELPKDLEEAARVDGATTIQAFQKVIVPLAAPGVFTTAILTFIFAWNEFLFANTFLFTADTQPVTVVIPQFATVYTVNYGAQAAAAVVVTVPLVIMVLIFQRRIVSGLTAGAVKG